MPIPKTRCEPPPADFEQHRIADYPYYALSGVNFRIETFAPDDDGTLWIRITPAHQQDDEQPPRWMNFPANELTTEPR